MSCGGSVEDISEGLTGFEAQVGVSQQLLQQRLSDRFPGVGPEPLRSRVPGDHLAVHVLGGLPGEVWGRQSR